jgi:hypothetical protein
VVYDRLAVGGSYDAAASARQISGERGRFMAIQVMSRRQMLAEGAGALLAVAVARRSFRTTSGAVNTTRQSSRHGEERMGITVQEADAGLASITDVRITNGTVELPSFAPGTRGPVLVAARKTDPRKPTSWSFVTVDVNGRRRRWA